MKITTTLLIFFLLLGSGSCLGREIIPLNQHWQLTGNDLFGETRSEIVDLPHSWNGAELWDEERQQTLGIQYSRGAMAYHKHLRLNKRHEGKRLFLHFGAANLVADVVVNGQHLAHHRGGFSAFVVDISDAVDFSITNAIMVTVDNSDFDDIAPLEGDFNIYGGLIRPVSLIVTNEVHISPQDFASEGVYLLPQHVSKTSADIDVVSHLHNSSDQEQTLQVVTTALNDKRRPVSQHGISITLPANSQQQVTQPLHFDKPRLWNGTKDPYLYTVKVEVKQGEEILDEVTEPLGLRYFSVDAEQGFLLNGEPYPLRGVSFHEDWPGRGQALLDSQREIDIEIIKEMGANALRLAHYPHGKHTLDLADREGFVVWSEIPLVGMPAGAIGGYNNSDAFHQTTRIQLQEMIRQRYNHPSIFFWGIYNELPVTDDPDLDGSAFVKELQQLAKAEDPFRPTVSASFYPDTDAPLNTITDLQFWNRYYGWYYGDIDSLGPWADATRQAKPQLAFGVSEYGSGASIQHHRDDLVKPYGIGDPVHEENWQAHQHEGNWRDIAERPWLAGSFIWAMFDFSSWFRREGDTMGVNDKGLVTYDRRIRKDAFYFYQANWSDQPLVHLTDKRNTYRDSDRINIKAYSNLDEVELFVNGTSMGTKSGDSVHRFQWQDIQLVDGNNAVVVKAIKNGQTYEDRAIWSYSFQAKSMVIVSPLVSERWLIIPVTFIILLFLYARGFRLDRTPGGHTIAKISFFILGLTFVGYLCLLIGMGYTGMFHLFN